MEILIYSLDRNSVQLTFNFSPLDLPPSYPSFSTAQATLSMSNDHGSFLLLNVFFGHSSYELECEPLPIQLPGQLFGISGTGTCS